jgi:hypothetical protein
MAVKERLRAGHGDDKARPCICGEIDFGERLPITLPIGVDEGLAHVAILSSARLRPKAVEREVGGVQAT